MSRKPVSVIKLQGKFFRSWCAGYPRALGRALPYPVGGCLPAPPSARTGALSLLGRLPSPLLRMLNIVNYSVYELMSAKSIPPPKVSDAVNVVLRVLNVKGSEVARTSGLTQPQAGLLRALHREGRVSATQLAAEVGFSLPALTNSLDFLSKRGLVLRSRDERDRRRVWIEITAKGRTLSRRYLENFHNLHKQVNALFSGERATALSDSLLVIARAMGAREEWMEQRCPLCHPIRARGKRP